MYGSMCGARQQNEMRHCMPAMRFPPRGGVRAGNAFCYFSASARRSMLIHGGYRTSVMKGRPTTVKTEGIGARGKGVAVVGCDDVFATEVVL